MIQYRLKYTSSKGTGWLRAAGLAARLMLRGSAAQEKSLCREVVVFFMSIDFGFTIYSSRPNVSPTRQKRDSKCLSSLSPTPTPYQTYSDRNTEIERVLSPGIT